MQVVYDEDLINLFEKAFDGPACYMLLPEQDSGHWEGQVEDIRVIHGLKDLAFALVDGLAIMGYERDRSKIIGVTKQEHGHIMLDIPFYVRLFPDEQGSIKFVLFSLKGASDGADE